MVIEQTKIQKSWKAYKWGLHNINPNTALWPDSETNILVIQTVMSILPLNQICLTSVELPVRREREEQKNYHLTYEGLSSERESFILWDPWSKIKTKEMKIIGWQNSTFCYLTLLAWPGVGLYNKARAVSLVAHTMSQDIHLICKDQLDSVNRGHLRI